MWDPSSLTRDQTRLPCSGSVESKYWTTGKILRLIYIILEVKQQYMENGRYK